MMKRILSVALAVIGAWVLASFAGAMFDTVRADFWTTSLMWSLLTTLVLGPVLVLLSSQSKTEEPAKPAPQPKTEPSFVSDEKVEAMRASWSSDEQEMKETA